MAEAPLDAVKALLQLYQTGQVKFFVLLLMCQVLSQFSNVVSSSGNGEYPQPAKSFVKGLGVANFDVHAVVPVDCMFPASSFKDGGADQPRWRDLVVSTVTPRHAHTTRRGRARCGARVTAIPRADSSHRIYDRRANTGGQRRKIGSHEALLSKHSLLLHPGVRALR